MVTTRSSTEYNRAAFWRFLFGEGWRDTWIAPITVPVLDLGAYAGGLEPIRKGGNQSKTLHFRGADGRNYVFRSTDKDINDALPSDLKDTPAGDIVRDQAAAMYPTGHLAVSTLQQALAVLHAPPTLVVLPNHERLGEFRELFANMVGQIEEKPDDYSDGKAFGGAEKVVSAQTLIENLEESLEDRFDSREYLKLRLLDFIIGDTDRGGDQLEFGKFESGDRDVYRVIARDRDYAFIKSEGFLVGLAAPFYPKLARFSSRHSKLAPLVFATRDFDRTHLVDLPRTAWDSVISVVQTQLTDDVIAKAISQLPESHIRQSGGLIAANLRARRDALRTITEQFYRMVNEDADIFASDEDERAEIERQADGSVTVRIWREATPVFERHFVPAETQEIRVFLERGNDRAVVRGQVDRSIEVRVIGGEGADVLIDSSRVAHGDKTHFYDAAGQNTIVTGARTRVIRTPFVGVLPKARDDDEEMKAKPRVLQEERRGRFKDLWADQEDFVAEKTKQPHAPNYGQRMGWAPMIDYREGSGVVVGFGPTLTDYGFRRKPYESRVALRGMVGVGSGDLGLQLDARRHFEVSPWSVSLFAHATQLEANRFYGYGNDTEAVARALSLVRRDELLVQPALNYHINEVSSISIGPVVKYVRADLIENSPAAQLDPLGTEPFGQLGARAEIVLDRSTKGTAQQSGFEVRLGGSGYPTVWDVADPFGKAHAQAQIFLPLGSQTFALRAGGERVWGTFPLHEAAFIGGRQTLRGFAWNRLAGDASAFGSAELRVPVARITLFTRGDFGLIGFADAGRVWMNGDSEGDWHTSTGGGVWFGSLGQSASLTYADGEEGRIYLSFGLPF
jgi:hypothetical protein